MTRRRRPDDKFLDVLWLLYGLATYFALVIDSGLSLQAYEQRVLEAATLLVGAAQDSSRGQT